MKIALSFLFSFLVCNSFAQLVVSDPNVEVRNIPSFESVIISGGIDVYFTKGQQEVVAVSASNENSRNRIVTEVKNGVLKISYQSNGPRIRLDEKLKVYISYTQLESITSSGACNINFAETLATEDLRVKLSGASMMSAALNITNLSLDLSGASTVKLSGNVKNLKLDCSGASDVKSYDLAVENCVASLSGASDTRLMVMNSIKVKASGASTFFYKGNPDKKDVSSSGASNVMQQ